MLSHILISTHEKCTRGLMFRSINLCNHRSIQHFTIDYSNGTEGSALYFISQLLGTVAARWTAGQHAW